MFARQVITLCLAAAPVKALLPSSFGSTIVIGNTPRLSFIVRSMSSADGVGLTDIGTHADNNQEKPVSTSPNRSWKSRIDESIARSRKIRGANYVQLSTVSADGEPRCRTVVFRGFQRLPSDHPQAIECGDSQSTTSCVMKMITDNRSNKVSEASQQFTAELVWWFAKSKEQYRIRGKLCFVGGGQFEHDGDKVLASARKEQWGSLSDPAREQFFWQEPGIPYTGESTVPPGGRDANGVLLEPPETFLLLFLLPARSDYLRLTDNYRQIDEFIDGTWKAQRINP
uniref:Pyridoxamine 5'-phosphate oxidase Alr4036 family FMN-binding domain-containing protein n=1 Tax=Cyclophora tenuis TaxID=216820 RepID=A0A7S1CWE6_CYCTE|mmetsp:Transcript_10831/g.18317  ORF Transcript_10831/g.18317 Transcript_10831/m.18317 type:complete len:284 (+) Transcript_10831:626-1477(+)